ncbi:MAG TPA: NAD-dependent protein deacylase [Cytophagales bacterium]|nr:NAD-dependent protein deacylase [Cytophagales bacterium]HAA22889.1 NAD-dependent protein deacylase [Cytophagales bacterium]HAP60556.1 NAD-dependent protein deacylase [Cytophagales bacterium]
MKKLVVLTGAGISADSGIPTFRGADGLWEGYDVTQVASPEGWAADPKLVLRFYNERRKKMHEVEPNPGHFAVADLEKHFKVVVITQNIDNLHERGGSSNIIHLHGELSKVRSTVDESLVHELDGWELKWGDLCEKGSQLRPHIVWFGEMVPMMEVAIREMLDANLVLVVGTSLVVYPAASLLEYAPESAPLFCVDPGISEDMFRGKVELIKEGAASGMPKMRDLLVEEYS